MQPRGRRGIVLYLYSCMYLGTSTAYSSTNRGEVNLVCNVVPILEYRYSGAAINSYEGRVIVFVCDRSP